MRGWKTTLAAFLLLISLSSFSQDYGQRPDSRNDGQSQDNRQNNRQNNRRDSRWDNRDDHSDRNARRASNFNNGLRDGGHGGQYYDSRHEEDGYNALTVKTMTMISNNRAG